MKISKKYLNAMVDKIYNNKYIPDYVPCDLPWYEKNGLLTYIDQFNPF